MNGDWSFYCLSDASFTSAIFLRNEELMMNVKTCTPAYQFYVQKWNVFNVLNIQIRVSQISGSQYGTLSEKREVKVQLCSLANKTFNSTLKCTQYVQTFVLYLVSVEVKTHPFSIVTIVILIPVNSSSHESWREGVAITDLFLPLPSSNMFLKRFKSSIVNNDQNPTNQ